MAKISRVMNFKNAVISLEDMSIVEISKDGSEEFDLMEILKSWDKVEGISMTIKQDSGLSLDLESSEDGE